LDASVEGGEMEALLREAEVGVEEEEQD
ncbi:hypothetical protein KIPB_013548, partial [Kipferlia bialata]